MFSPALLWGLIKASKEQGYIVEMEESTSSSIEKSIKEETFQVGAKISEAVESNAEVNKCCTTVDSVKLDKASTSMKKNVAEELINEILEQICKTEINNDNIVNIKLDGDDIGPKETKPFEQELQTDQVQCNRVTAVPISVDSSPEAEQVTPTSSASGNTRETASQESTKTNTITDETQSGSNVDLNKNTNRKDLIPQHTMDSTEPGSLNSSINRSHAYEKLLRKQLASGDEGWTGNPELESIIVSDHSQRSISKDYHPRSVTAHEAPSVVPGSKAHSSKGVRHEYKTTRETNGAAIVKGGEESKEKPGLILRLRDTTDYDDGEFSRTHDTHRDHLSYARDLNQSSSRTNSGGIERKHDHSEYSGKIKDVNSSIPNNRLEDKHTEDRESRVTFSASPRNYPESSTVVSPANSRQSQTNRREKSRESSPSRRNVSPSRSSSNDAKARPPESDRGSRKPRDYNEERQRIRDLEETEAALKRLLRDREQEVDNLRTRNRTLQDRLEKAGTEQLDASRGPDDTHREQSTNFEQEINDLIREKENLKTEVFQLQQHLSETRGRSSSRDSESSGERQEVLDKYKPNNPLALQRKIDELQGQVQDLTEASESAGKNYSVAEEELARLKEENENLRVANEINLGDLERENKRLRERLNMMTIEHPDRGLSTGNESLLRQEVAELRYELRGLRERNHKLNEDNIQLRDRLVDFGATLDLPGKDYTVSTERSLTGDKVSPFSLRSVEDRELRLHKEHSNKAAPPKRSYRDDFIISRDYESQSLRSFDQRSDTSRGSFREDTRSMSDSRPYVYNRADDALARSAGYRRDNHGQRSLSLGRDELLNGDRSPPGYSPDSNRNSLRTSLSPSRSRMSKIDVEEFPRSSSYRRSSERYRDDPRGYKDIIIDSKLNSAAAPAVNGYATLPSDYKFKEKSTRLSREKGYSTETRERIYTYQRSDKDRSDKDRDFIDEAGKERRYIPNKGPHREPMYWDINGDVSTTKEQIVRREYDLPIDPKLALNFAEERRQTSTGSDQKLMTDIARELHLDIDNRDVELSSLPMERKQRQRSESVGSANTDCILTEAEESLRFGEEQRPKSPELNDLMNDQLGLKPTPPSTPPPLPPHGHRTVVPEPMVTQHNKHLVGIQRQTTGFSTSGLRPFAPRGAADINVNDVVKFCRDGGAITRGQVKYVGHLPGKSQVFLGVEVEREDGKHDGEYDGQRYFTCKPNRGLFISFDKVVMAWGNSE